MTFGILLVSDLANRYSSVAMPLRRLIFPVTTGVVYCMPGSCSLRNSSAEPIFVKPLTAAGKWSK